MIPDPDSYATISSYDLLTAAARGYAGIDQRFIHALVDDPAKSLPGLIRFAAEDHSEDPVDLEEDLLAIFQYLRAPEAIPYFIGLLRRDPHEVPDELVEAIVGVAPAALEPLIALYQELGEEEGGEVAFTLAALGVRDERVLKLLLERLEYDAADGALCLTLYGDPAAIPALEQLRSGIPESDAELRGEIGFAIEQIQRDQGEPRFHPEFDIWSLYPEKARPPVRVLPEEQRVELLASAAAEVRAEAASSFRNSEYSRATRDRLFEVAKGDADPDVRGRAWEALGEASDEPAIRQAMLAVLEDEGAALEEKTGALVGLAMEAKEPRVEAAIERLYALPEARAKALEAMWRSLDRSFAPYFPKHLDDSDPEIRRHAVFGVGYLGIYSEAHRLRAFFDDEELRFDALFAYALSVPAEISRGRIRSVLRKIEKETGELSQDEAELVMTALDERLAFHGMDPVFFPDTEEEMPLPEEPEPALLVGAAKTTEKAGRNDPCPCGSGKKFKKCCGG